MFYWPLQSWEEGLGGELDEGRIENRLKSPPQGLDQDWDEVRIEKDLALPVSMLGLTLNRRR